MSEFKMTSTRESTVEDAVIAWAENHGWVVRLMSYRGRRGCPDNFFFGYGAVLPIEFKKPKGERSAAQVREHARLAQAGVKVPTFDRADEAIEYLRSYMPWR